MVISRWLAVVAALAATTVAGCATPPGHDSTPSSAAIRLAAPQAIPALPAGLQVTHAWQLPKSLHASAYGAVASSHYAFFGVAAPGSGNTDAEVGPQERTSYAVLDLETGDVTTFPAVELGRSASLGVITEVGGTTYLIHREDQERPAEDCPQSQETCWTWTLYAQQLPGGPAEEIASARAPGLPFYLPRPAATDDGVAWLQDSDTPERADLIDWSPSTGTATIASKLPHTALNQLSVSKGVAWFDADGSDQTAGALWSIDLTTKVYTYRPLPKGAQRAAVVDDTVQFAVPARSGSGFIVVAAPALSPRQTHTLGRLSDVYALVALNANQAIASDQAGYSLVGDGGGPLPVPPLWGVHHSQGVTSFFLDTDGGQILVIA